MTDWTPRGFLTGRGGRRTALFAIAVPIAAFLLVPLPAEDVLSRVVEKVTTGVTDGVQKIKVNLAAGSPHQNPASAQPSPDVDVISMPDDFDTLSAERSPAAGPGKSFLVAAMVPVDGDYPGGLVPGVGSSMSDAGALGLGGMGSGAAVGTSGGGRSIPVAGVANAGTPDNGRGPIGGTAFGGPRRGNGGPAKPGYGGPSPSDGGTAPSPVTVATAPSDSGGEFPPGPLPVESEKREDLIVNGLLQPGNSPGTLHVNSLEMGPQTIIEIEIGGLVPGLEYDQVIVDGLLVLDGLLRILQYNDFIPDVGDTFEIFKFGSLAGAFDTIEGLDITDTLYYEMIFNANDITLEVFSREVIPVVSSFIVTQVPEPETLLVFLIGLAGMAVVRRRRSVRAG